MKAASIPKALIGLALLSGGLATATAGALLTNGDFQTGDLTGWTTFTTSNGTNGSGLPDVVSFDITGSGASLAAHFDVGEVTFDGTPQGGGLYQDVNIATAGTYLFSLNIASQDGASGAINSDAGTFSILIDGNTVSSDSLGGFTSSLQILRGTLSGSVNLGAGSHQFEILLTRNFTSASGGQTPDEYVDNAILGTAAPEPATFGLCGAALAGLTLFRRLRRA